MPGAINSVNPFYAQAQKQKPLAVPPKSNNAQYDYATGNWKDAMTGAVVQPPANTFYTTDANGNPVVTSDANLYQTYATQNGQRAQASTDALYRNSLSSTLSGAQPPADPNAGKISTDELNLIKQAIGYNNTTQAPPPPPSAAVEAAARASAFARAKDKAGQIARSSMTALRDALNARGMIGTDYEVSKSADVLGGAANSLGEQNRTQLEADLEQARQEQARQYQYQQDSQNRQQQSMQSLMQIIMSRGGLY